MRRPIVQGIGILGLCWGLAEARSLAQDVTWGSVTPRAPAGAPQPGTMNRPIRPQGAPAAPRLALEFQEPPPAPRSSGTTEPPSPEGGAVPPPESDIALPRSERAGGGGEPTTAAAAEEKAQEAKAEETPGVDESKLLMNFLGRADAPVKVYGWIQNSFTGNTLGTPKNALNFGVNPNFLANRWMGNQYYLIVENPLEQNDQVNFGFRVDNLFGNDWQFNHMRGLNENSFQLNHFAGYDPAQIYGEVHLPYLTKGGIDVKGGRFYTILGYEVVPAIGRPLLSVPYMFNYGQPFTHFGMISTLHLTDRINILNGTVNGWDRWINAHYDWNYIGGVTWTSKDSKANLAVSYIFGPNQYPRFLSRDTQIILPGNTVPPHLDGRRNLNYANNNRIMFTTVFSYKWTEKLTQVMETDEGFEENIPGSGISGGDRNNSWYSFGNWFLYSLTDKLTGVWRAEVFRDHGGQRTGFSDNFYEQTLGLIYKPKPWLWIRPEARYDWSQFTHPYFDGTKKSQFTLGVDAILLY